MTNPDDYYAAQVDAINERMKKVFDADLLVMEDQRRLIQMLKRENAFLYLILATVTIINLYIVFTWR